MDGGTSNLCPEPVVRFGTLFLELFHLSLKGGIYTFC